MRRAKGNQSALCYTCLSAFLSLALFWHCLSEIADLTTLSNCPFGSIHDNIDFSFLCWFNSLSRSSQAGPHVYPIWPY